MSKLFFESVRQDRGSYFIKYSPPSPATPFAMLSLTFPGEVSSEVVAHAMEDEVVHWVRRYPIGTAAYAVDRNGDGFELSPSRPFDWLAAVPQDGDQAIKLEWRLLNAGEFPDPAWPPEKLREVFADIPCKTQEEVRSKALRNAHSMRQGMWIFALWIAGVPIVFALLQYRLEWLGMLAMIYTIGKATMTYARMMGYRQPLAREQAKEAEDLRKAHHHYHCERNPAGFNRLKIENFEREGRERVQAEAAQLKSLGKSSSDTKVDRSDGVPSAPAGRS